jgi:D-xylose transport system substrate-binding protein
VTSPRRLVGADGAGARRPGRLAAFVAVAALGLTSTACGGSDEKPTVGVLFPDSPRWASVDGPRLETAFGHAGLRSEIRNAHGDRARFRALCESMVSDDLQVLVVASPDATSGTACLKAAAAAGIRTIDYDRLTPGGGASYLVAFDDVKAGELMGRGLLTCLDRRGERSPNVVSIEGDPTDAETALLKAGSTRALQRRIDAGALRIVGDETGLGSAAKAGTAFAQLYARNRGRIDGVVAADDTTARGVIARLRAHRLAGKVPVTGRGATVHGLQAVLDGSQCMTVDEDPRLESTAAASLAIALTRGDTAKVHALASGTVEDTETGKDVPSALVSPRAIFRDSVNEVISDGSVPKRAVCAGRFATLCRTYGVS